MGKLYILDILVSKVSIVLGPCQYILTKYIGHIVGIYSYDDDTLLINTAYLVPGINNIFDRSLVTVKKSLSHVSLMFIQNSFLPFLLVHQS